MKSAPYNNRGCYIIISLLAEECKVFFARPSLNIKKGEKQKRDDGEKYKALGELGESVGCGPERREDAQPRHIKPNKNSQRMRIRIKERNRKKRKEKIRLLEERIYTAARYFPVKMAKGFFFILFFCGKRCAVGVKSDSVGTGGVSAVVDVEPTGRFSFSLS